jgi:hypothetical protein
MMSIIFIYECITDNTTVNHCIRFNHISLVMERTCNNEVISIHFVLINYSKSGQTKFMKRKCQSCVCAAVSTWDIEFSTNLEEGRAISAASALTTKGAVCAIETLNGKRAT